jgi:hypothetical protein
MTRRNCPRKRRHLPSQSMHSKRKPILELQVFDACSLQYLKLTDKIALLISMLSRVVELNLTQNVS